MQRDETDIPRKHPTNADETMEEIVMSETTSTTTPTQATEPDGTKKVDQSCCTVPPPDPGPST